MSTVSAHVAGALALHVDHVFGVMGNGNAHFLDALERRTGTHYVAMRHEAGAVAAADAYYRASGRLAAATTTFGAGLTNALTPLTESVQARIPLVLVTGDQPTSGPRPWDVDQVALAGSVGATTFRVGPDDAVATTARAVEHALRGRTAAVLAIPVDLARAEAGDPPPVPVVRTAGVPAPLDDEALRGVRQLAQRLAAARRPVLLAGRGAWLADAGKALGDLADATGAVTASTALARGIFPRAEFDLGVTGGFGAAGAMRLVHEADVVVAWGASLNQFQQRFGELFGADTHVVQVDVGPAPTTPRVDHFVAGDAALVAQALAEELEAMGATPSGFRESLDPAPLRERDPGDDLAPDGRLDPRSVARRIAELLPQDRVVVSDGGHFIGWANMYWPVASPDRMMMVGTAYQTIGLGWPSLPGAALARPDSTVVLTSGDGGSLMAMADFESAIQVAGGRGLAVIWNDGAYGAEVNLYGLQGLAPGPMRIPVTDFAAHAEAAGAEGVVVRELADLDRLAEWAGTAPADRRFLLLDLRISTDVIAPYQHEVIRVNAR